MTTKKTESNPTTNIYQKLQLIQSQIGQLEKTRENKFQKYFYAGEYDLLKVIKPLLEKQQLVLLFSDDINEQQPLWKEQIGKEWMVQYTKQAQLINAENPQEQLTYRFWAMAQNTDLAKAKGSAETYAIKYFLQKFFLIPTDNNLDPDAFGSKEDNKDKHDETISKTSTVKLDLTNPIKAVIKDIKTKLDKNDNKYLLLETDILPNNVFVFDYKVESVRWPQFKKGQAYQFQLEESPNGLLTLLDFSESN
ncbi:MAG: hypothetical protein mread185_000316 [Mycoplasmataceae bacterium]|nr:MAG: hypothetical protein mread185_000316 [Mycoplasmataceae bacterium]